MMAILSLVRTGAQRSKAHLEIALMDVRSRYRAATHPAMSGRVTRRNFVTRIGEQYSGQPPHSIGRAVEARAITIRTSTG